MTGTVLSVTYKTVSRPLSSVHYFLLCLFYIYRYRYHLFQYLSYHLLLVLIGGPLFSISDRCLKLLHCPGQSPHSRTDAVQHKQQPQVPQLRPAPPAALML